MVNESPGAMALVLTRQGEDAQVIGLVCEASQFHWRSVQDTEMFCDGVVEDSTTAVIATEESLDDRLDEISRCLADQPAWSDLPIIVLTFSKASQRLGERWQALQPLGNVTLLERPLRVETLRAALYSASRARRRQYMMREHMMALEQSTTLLENAVRDRTALLQSTLQELRQTEKALVQSQRLEAIGQLTGGVAHDFNNLLQVILSSASLLELSKDRPEMAARSLELIRRTAERGAKLTQQLLAFASRQPLSAQRLELPGLLLALRPILDRSLRDDIEVDLRVDDGLWPVYADATQLEVALLNLAINARDAMPHGGRLSIAAENVPAGAKESHDQVKITVSDTGHGMSEAVAQRVFEPFFSTKSAQGKGTGLGLSQVYGFARQSGGEAKLERTSPAGTTFALSLPRDVSETHAERGQPGGPAQGQGIERLVEAEATVLIVDDDVDVAASTAALLEAMGCRCLVAHSGEEALSMVDGGVDIVLSDVMMPGLLDGVALSAELRRRRPDLPVILISGYVGVPDRVADTGLPLLTKPLAVDQLRQAVRAALKDRASRGSVTP